MSTLIDSMQASLLSSNAINADRYYSYGRDYYVNGLPEEISGAMVLNSNLIRAAILEDLDDDSISIEILGNWIGKLTTVGFIAYSYLARTYDTWENQDDYITGTTKKYSSSTLDNSTTVTITYDDGSTETFITDYDIYLDNSNYLYLVSVYNETMTLTTTTEVTVNITYTSETVDDVTTVTKTTETITYIYTQYEDISTDTTTVSEVVDEMGEDSSTVTSTSESEDSTKLQYWVYSVDTGTHSEIFGTGISDYTTGYYPIVPLRLDNESIDDGSYDDLYESATTLLDKLDVDIDDVIESIEESDSLADMDNVYFMLGIDIYTDTDYGKEYLYDFFVQLYNSYVSMEATTATTDDGETSYLINISDGTYDMSLSYASVEFNTYDGSIGDVGDVIRTISDSDITMQRQIDEDTYTEVTVYSLIHYDAVYNVEDVYSTEISDDGGNFIIPLNYYLMRNYTLNNRNNIIQEAMTLTITVREETYIHWYETEFFSFVVLAASIVYLAVTWDPSGVAWAMALAAGNVYLASLFIVGAYVATTYGVEWAAGELGSDIAFYIAIALAIYGVTSFDASIQMPFATETLKASTMVASASASVAEDEISELTDALTELEEEYEDLYDELDELEDELYSNIYIDTLDVFTSVDMTFYDTPDTWITRKINNNVGQASIDYITNYVDISLYLKTSTI